MSTRDRILDAAISLFEEAGFEGLTMRAVARRVDLTPMALYRHFADRDALVNALTDHGMAAWGRRLAAIDALGPLDWLAAAGAAFLDFALEEPRAYEAAFLLPARGARRYPDDFRGGSGSPGGLVLARIEAACAGGLLTGVSAMEAMISFAALAQGLIGLYRAGRVAGGEAGFRSLYAGAMRRCLASFTAAGVPA